MIKTQQNNEAITLFYKRDFPLPAVFDFLKSKGYILKEWQWEYTDETFPGGISHSKKMTFTATKGNETQREENIFSTVFEREMNQALKKVLLIN